MTYDYRIQSLLKQYTCTYTCLFICYMSTGMDPEIFARMVGGPSPTDRKEPWQHFSPQLILQWGPNGYFKETIIFEESRQGVGSQISGGPTFSKVMGRNCIIHDHLKIFMSPKSYIFSTTKTTLRWLYRDHNFTVILSYLRKLRCILVRGHNR